MRVQYFSDEYISETETVDLIEKVSEKYKDIEGKILYKFPSIKELDKKVIVPDILIASEIMGIIVIVVDAMQADRRDAAIPKALCGKTYPICIKHGS